MDLILQQAFNITLNIFKKTKHEEDIDKPLLQIYVNKIENRVTFKTKNGYSLELLTHETMKLLGSTENKITKNKNDEKVPHLELQKQYWFILILFVMIINKIQESCIHLFLINRLVAYQKFLQQIKSFLKTFDSEYDEIKVCFTYQKSQPLEIEDRINLTMVIK